MNPWLIATLEGMLLGVLLYLCVRFRIRYGQSVRERFGSHARHMFWAAMILIMVVLANVGLIILRQLIPELDTDVESVLLELWFAMVALMVGFGLVYKRVNRPK